MSHHVTHQIALEYLETPRQTKWQTAYRMHTAGAANMQADAEQRGWHLWRIVLVEISTGKREAYLAQQLGAGQEAT